MSRRLTDVTARFSGQEHRRVLRVDGRRFWLDPAFLYALEHAGDPDLTERLVELFGATPEEAREIPGFLREAGLLETGKPPGGDEPG